MPLFLAVCILMFKRHRVALPPLLIGTLATAAAIYGKEVQYPVYIVVFGGPLLAIGLEQSARWTRPKLATGTLVAAMLAALLPGFMLLSRGVSELGTGRALAVATAGRTVLVDGVAARLYFTGNPSAIRIMAPVPTDPSAIAGVARNQDLVVADPDAVAPWAQKAGLIPIGDVAGCHLWQAGR